jgi:hypothetical protein
MSSNASVESITKRVGFDPRSPAWIGIIIAAAAVVVGALTPLRENMWPALLVNLLFWGAIAQGMLIWAAVFWTAKAEWTAGVNRLGHAAAGFLPVSVVVYLLLFVGVGSWLTWSPLFEPKGAWLNVPFLFVRCLVCYAALAWLSLWFVRLYRRADDLATYEKDDELQATIDRMGKVSIALIITYAFAFSMISYDLIMSLSPMWISTMFGGYFFIGSMFAALAALIITATLARDRLPLGKHLGSEQYRNLGNLLLGFSIFTAGLMFAQWLTIWYGNIPEETEFLIDRFYYEPWKTLSILTFVLAFLAPFVFMQNNPLKENPRRAWIPAVIVLVGMLIERTVLIVPSIQHEAPLLTFAFIGVIAPGFLGGLVITMRAHLRANDTASPVDLSLRARNRAVEEVSP